MKKQMKKKYPSPFSVRLNPDDYKKLRKLATKTGISSGAIVKMAIKRVLDNPKLMLDVLK